MSVEDLRKITERIPKVRPQGLPTIPKIFGFPSATWSQLVTCEICGQKHHLQYRSIAPMQCPYCGRYVYGKLPKNVQYTRKGIIESEFVHENCWNHQYNCCKFCAIFIEEAIGKVKCQYCGAIYNRIETSGRCPYCQGLFQSIKRE